MLLMPSSVSGHTLKRTESLAQTLGSNKSFSKNLLLPPLATYSTSSSYSPIGIVALFKSKTKAPVKKVLIVHFLICYVFLATVLVL